MGRKIWPIAVAAMLVLGLLATTGGAREHRRHAGRSAEAKGLVYDGLRPKEHGACAHVFRVETTVRNPMCSHGPDPAPDGIDVTEHRSIADLSGTDGAPGSAAVPCFGDGSSGSRVQAIYAVASDLPDRSAQVVPLITGWAGQMDAAVNKSAAETGGQLHVRFVTTPACALNVATVRLSSTGDDSFGNTINELRVKGFDEADRKYLIWADATVYCGIGQLTDDDSAGSGNNANSWTMYARVDSGCWGRSDHLSELHELMHTLGAVQLSAPHSSGGYHCTDESDAMCYSDAAAVAMTYVCPGSHEWLLDCNHDDYFSTSPRTARTWRRIGTWRTACSSPAEAAVSRRRPPHRLPPQRSRRHSLDRSLASGT
jgi:hypothetical protein